MVERPPELLPGGTQHLEELRDREKGDISLASLDPSNECSMEACQVSEPLLRDSALFADRSYRGPEAL